MIVDPQLSQREGVAAPEAELLRDQFKPLSRLRQSLCPQILLQPVQSGETMTTFLQRFDDIVRALSDWKRKPVSVQLR
jgi:hypothetical protein